MQPETIPIDPYLQQELKPGEQLLWWGRPDPARKVKSANATGNTVFYIVLMIAMVVLLCYNIRNIIEDMNNSIGLDPFSIFLLFVSLALLSIYAYRFYTIYNAITRNTVSLRNTVYGITNQRIIVFTAGARGVGVKSHTRSDIGQITRNETGEGWGDISYGIPQTRQIGRRVTTVVDKLVGIPHARFVEDILIRTFKQNDAPTHQAWYPAQPQGYPPQPQQYMPPTSPYRE